jgi:ceramide glucosyltransferase
MIEMVLFTLVLCSWIYWIVCTCFVYRFYSMGEAEQVQNDPSFLPGVSILKPVHGLEYQCYSNFASFCCQDYPVYEIIFAVASPFDPAIHIITRLQRNYPGLPISLLIVPVNAPNEKAGLLAEISRYATGEILVISDSDMKVTPDYLRRVVQPLHDPKVGLVTCAYRGENALNLSARLGALHMGVMFLPSVMVGRKFLNMRFAMGATLALRARDLDDIGGFDSISDFLADDYQIALRISETGKRVVLSDYIVTCQLGEETFYGQWSREVRWARTNRANRPWEYPGLFPLYTITWSTLYALVDVHSIRNWQLLLASIFFRFLSAWIITRSTKDSESARWLILLPLRDLVSTLVWLLGSISNRVQWRGRVFEITDEGRMEPIELEEGWRERLARYLPHS